MPPHSRKMSQRNASGGRGSASSSEPKEDAEASTKASIENTIIRLKRQVNSERQAYVKEKIEANTEKLRRFSRQLLENADQRASMNSSLGDRDLLSVRIQRALSKFGAEASGAQDGNAQDDSSAPIVVGSTSGSKSVVKPVRLQAAQKIPPYTTWIFLNRNQRMAEDQSVVGRRRIYYDSAGNEALICSDSEEEQVEEEEEKREFSKGDDYIIRTTVQEHGIQKVVWKALADCVDVKASDIEARYHTLMAEAERGGVGKLDEEKFQDLSSAMDSFDNLFCRRCLVFDCRLHGCSQTVVLPCEKQSPMKRPGELPAVPCGPCCFHQTRLLRGEQTEASSKTEEKAQDGGLTRTPKKGFFDKRVNALRRLLKRKAGRPSDDDTDQTRKKPRGDTDPYIKFDHGNNVPLFASASLKQRVAKKLVKLKISCQSPSRLNRQATIKKDDDSKSEISSSARKELISNWNALEKGLYEKGVQIFGRDSCLISKNLLRGLKTCVEVGEFMQLDGWRPHDERSYHLDGLGATVSENVDGERSRPRLYNGRRRGRVRKLKYTWKSVGPSLRKRLEGKEGCRQYTPCSCTSTCGKQCSCIRNSTCCEKYCGCSKACKNRFRGCHCAKSQCSSRQCPCFAAGRECDPDVCRNCWVGCGDGSLGDPPSRGDSYECRNMKLLLKQQQRVLLGRSDVAGWGAFLKAPVNKHDYLGEYTGELISHREADKRGKIYDRENSSFLFNLNDQYVLDACRKGDKLKFANHSPNPNCYAKVIMVAGDHRVGIFAKERIAAGEELFYDYRYEADRAPAWARKPEDNHKHDESGSGSGRAQKTA